MLFRFCRNVYERANRELKNAEEKEERLMLLESWKQFEVSNISFVFILSKIFKLFKRHFYYLTYLP